MKYCIYYFFIWVAFMSPFFCLLKQPSGWKSVFLSSFTKKNFNFDVYLKSASFIVNTCGSNEAIETITWQFTFGFLIYFWCWSVFFIFICNNISYKFLSKSSSLVIKCFLPGYDLHIFEWLKAYIVYRFLHYVYI